MAELLGAESAALLASLAEPPTVGLRLNTLRTALPGTRERVLAGLPWGMEAVPWCADGFQLTGGVLERRPGLHPWHDAGVYYLQDPAAMAVAEALAPRPGERVLDLAAAPGGKSTHIAALQAGEGLLVCNDHHPQRARSLLGNIERCGIGHAAVCQSEPERLASAFGDWFDRVLLDAPCSGEGMFRKSDEALQAWSPAVVAACSLRQRRLIEVAARMVRPGGVLGYSTCTFSRAENEDVIESFLASHPDFAPVAVRLPGVSAALGRTPSAAPALGAGAVRLWPQRAPGEGHFVAVLRRAEAEPGLDGQRPPSGAKTSGRPRRGKPPLDRPSREQLAAWRAHFAEVAPRAARDALDEDRLFAHGAKLLLAPPTALPDLAGVFVLRLGLALGEMSSRGRTPRFVPAHAAAMAAGTALDLNGCDLEPDDPRLSSYLAGEAFDDGGEDGTVVVKAGGFPVGWGVRRRGSVRSLLPSGLRRRPSVS